MMKKILLVVATCFLATLLRSSLLSAADETFPNRPITLINPLSAGGTYDVILRFLAEDVGKRLGQPVIVTNKTGGQFIIATTELKDAHPDGYTIGFVTFSSLFVLPNMEKTPYDPLNDFKPIAQYADAVFAVTVKADAPYKTWKDLVAAAKTQKLRVGHSGPNSIQAVVINLLGKKEGFSLINIPYKSGVDYHTALLGGHVDFVSGELNYSFVEAGKTRVLLTYSDTRSSLIPEVPCMKDVGHEEYAIPLPLIILAPKATPDPIMKKLEKAFGESLKEPAYIAKAKELALQPTIRSSAETAAYMKISYDRIERMLIESGLKK